MKKLSILGCLVLFLVSISWAQEKVESPVWKVGDKWVYKSDSGIETTMECVGDEKDLFVVNRNVSQGQRKGKSTLYYDKKDLTCVKITRNGKEDKEERDRMKKGFNFPLFPGKKWTSRYSFYNPAYNMDNDISPEYSVIGVEDVQVPAGKFKALKVMVKLNITELKPPQRQFSGVFHYWWAPDVRAIVKYETDRSSLFERAEYQKYELVSFELK